MTQTLAAHLWQSTLFALAAGLMTAAFRGNRAQVRYWLWLSASLKFLVPFALLLNLGSYLETRMPVARQVASQIATPVVSWTVEEFSSGPLVPATLPQSSAATSTIDWIPIALVALWLGGVASVAFIRFRAWLRIRAAVRDSAVFGRSKAATSGAGISETVEIRVSPCNLGPAVVGIMSPVLLFPEGIAERLTPSELETVLAHELCHVRRRDNLFAAIHMVVEAVFWFHPLLWLISARLVEEREKACDEEVLSLGSHPEIYADAILNVCKFYVQSPLVCASGVSGASIRRRIEAIMLSSFEGLSRAKMSRVKKLLLAGAGTAALVGPVVIGLLIGAGNAAVMQTQSPVPAGQKFEVAAIHPCNRNAAAPGLREMGGLGDVGPAPNRVTIKCVKVMTLLKDAYITFADGQNRGLGVQAPPIEGAPAWISSDLYTIEATAGGAPGQSMMRGPMMQSLLEDRFHLKLHRETRSGPAYELTVAKGGSKLKANDGGCSVDLPSGAVPRDPATGNPVSGFAPGGRFRIPPPGPGQPCHVILSLNNGPNRLLVAQGMTLDEFSAWLFHVTNYSIIDKTGLAGKYDIRLEYLPGGTPSVIAPGDDPNEADTQAEATLTTAIKQQLGLQLTSVKGTRQIIVIDHVERPSEN
jgi:bla regulator protein blaR1